MTESEWQWDVSLHPSRGTLLDVTTLTQSRGEEIIKYVHLLMYLTAKLNLCIKKGTTENQTLASAAICNPWFKARSVTVMVRCTAIPGYNVTLFWFK